MEATTTDDIVPKSSEAEAVSAYQLSNVVGESLVNEMLVVALKVDAGFSAVSHGRVVSKAVADVEVWKSNDSKLSINESTVPEDVLTLVCKVVGAVNVVCAGVAVLIVEAKTAFAIATTVSDSALPSGPATDLVTSLFSM